MSSALAQQAPSLAADADLPTTLRFVEQQYGPAAALACSFSAEDLVIIHAAREHAPSLKVFALDTGRLPPETYELAAVLERRFGLQVETYFPLTDSVQTLVTQRGHQSFRQSIALRQECCYIRKVEPLNRALQGRTAWLTGLRREQSPTRTGLPVLETDAAHGGIAKVNPVASWSEAQVWAYVRQHALPYNALYDQGYRSIGCAPCTRALKPWEDARAGRWWWEDPDKKECGLHPAR